MPIKVVYIISDIDKALAFEWINDFMDKRNIDLQFILLGHGNTSLISFLKNRGVTHYSVPFAGRADLMKAWRTVFSILSKENPDAVHTHLYYANLIGLSAAWLLRIRKRVHTRHHSSFHHDYFPSAVYVDKLINRLSTHIVVLCTRQRKIVVEWEGVPEKKVYLIPHGFDLHYFYTGEAAKVRSLRNVHKLPDGAFPVVGVISRYTELKGIQFIIPAFKTLLHSYSGAHLILANAHGDYAVQVKALLLDLPVGSYTEILFEPELASLYKMFDLFIHAPIDEYCEAFGQTYVEALASGVPAIFTLSGIANDFIQHKKNAWVVQYKNSAEIASAMIGLLGDASLKANLIQAGRQSVEERFDIREMTKKLEDLYAL
jgi:glycosyltransferase involved in cell wall biosynthesis